MRYHAHFCPKITLFIEINTPGITAALGENLERMGDRMITPNPCIHPLTLGLSGTGFADMRRAENSVAAVEPSIRAPSEGVQSLVGIRSKVPSIQ